MQVHSTSGSSCSNQSKIIFPTSNASAASKLSNKSSTAPAATAPAVDASSTPASDMTNVYAKN